MKEADKENHISRKFLIAFLIVIVLQVLTMIYFGTLKSGFHEDEYYSYFSSNRTNGFFYPDHEWVETSELLKEYEVLEGEGFQYSLVKLVQSWDVHPPLYYYVLHTVCSLTPGVFSKWQGLAVNLFFFVILEILLAALALAITDRNETIALVTTALYGFSPAAVSMVMFIRMYTMLTAFVLASALATIGFYRAASKAQNAPAKAQKSLYKYAILSAVITLMGFLTQYYYLIFIFFTTIMLGVLLIHAMHRSGFKYWVVYCIGQMAAGVLGILHYPACLSQIFRGYRGKQAQEAFVDAGNLFSRLSTFARLIDQYLFDSIGLIVVLVIIAAFVYGRRFRFPGALKEKAVLLLAVAAAGYFAVVAKTALLLGDSSLRYEMPVLPILMLFAVMALSAALKQKQTLRIALSTAGMLLLGLSLYNLAQHNVLFLYEDETAKINAAKTYSDQPVVVIYNPETPDNVSRLTDQLLCYDKLYYVDASDTNAIDEPEIADADTVVIYAADSDTTEDVLAQIAGCMMKNTSGLVTEEKLYHKDMWTAYIFGQK